MSESIYKNNELENEMTLYMSYFWYSDQEQKNQRCQAKGTKEKLQVQDQGSQKCRGSPGD